MLRRAGLDPGWCRDATVRVRWNATCVSLARIARTLERFGYKPHPAKGLSRRDLHRRDERKRLMHLGVAGAIMGNTMLLGFAVILALIFLR